MTSINKWDPVSNSWGKVADMHQHRNKHAVTVVRCNNVLQTCSWQCSRKVLKLHSLSLCNKISLFDKVVDWRIWRLQFHFVLGPLVYNRRVQLFLTLSDLLWVTPSKTLVRKSVSANLVARVLSDIWTQGSRLVFRKILMEISRQLIGMAHIGLFWCKITWYRIFFWFQQTLSMMGSIFS